MVRLIIALIIIAAVLMLFGRAGSPGYVGGISAGNKTTALPGGPGAVGYGGGSYRSEAPNNPYTGN